MALDLEPELLAALGERARDEGLAVRTVAADAAEFALEFALGLRQRSNDALEALREMLLLELFARAVDHLPEILFLQVFANRDGHQERGHSGDLHQADQSPAKASQQRIAVGGIVG